MIAPNALDRPSCAQARQRDEAVRLERARAAEKAARAAEALRVREAQAAAEAEEKARVAREQQVTATECHRVPLLMTHQAAWEALHLILIVPDVLPNCTGWPP